MWLIFSHLSAFVVIENVHGILRTYIRIIATFFVKIFDTWRWQESCWGFISMTNYGSNDNCVVIHVSEIKNKIQRILTRARLRAASLKHVILSYLQSLLCKVKICGQVNCYLFIKQLSGSHQESFTVIQQISGNHLTDFKQSSGSLQAVI